MSYKDSSKNLLIAIGTRRSKAEQWIAELPQRFPDLEIQIIRRDTITKLPGTPETDILALVDQPYCEIGSFQEDVRLATGKGFQVYAQYFPVEPLFVLIQADMQHRENALGAAILKKEIGELRTEASYRQILDRENLPEHHG